MNIGGVLHFDFPYLLSCNFCMFFSMLEIFFLNKMFKVVYLSSNQCPLKDGKLAVYKLEAFSSPKLLKIYSLVDFIKCEGHILQNFTAISETKFMIRCDYGFTRKNNTGFVFDVDENGVLSFDFQFLQHIIYYQDHIFKERSLYIQSDYSSRFKIYNFLDKGRLIHELKSKNYISQIGFVGTSYIYLQDSTGVIELYHIDSEYIVTKIELPHQFDISTDNKSAQTIHGFSNSNHMVIMNRRNEMEIYSIPECKREYTRYVEHVPLFDRRTCFNSEIQFMDGSPIEFVSYHQDLFSAKKELKIVILQTKNGEFKEDSITNLFQYMQNVQQFVTRQYSCKKCLKKQHLLNETEDERKEREHNISLVGFEHTSPLCPQFHNFVACRFKKKNFYLTYMVERKDLIHKTTRLMKELVNIVWEYDYCIPQTLM